jgi:hypothetical protein
LKEALNIDVALNAVLVMATCFLGMRYFRSAEADATLLFFISMACFAGLSVAAYPQTKKWPICLC